MLQNDLEINGPLLLNVVSLPKYIARRAKYKLSNRVSALSQQICCQHKVIKLQHICLSVCLSVCLYVTSSEPQNVLLWAWNWKHKLMKGVIKTWPITTTTTTYLLNYLLLNLITYCN